MIPQELTTQLDFPVRIGPWSGGGDESDACPALYVETFQARMRSFTWGGIS